MGITFILMYSLSLSFGFNICWYSTYLFPNAFLRIQRIAKKNSGLSRFFSFMEFSVIYWIRNNSPFLFYLLLGVLLFCFFFFFWGFIFLLKKKKKKKKKKK